MQNYTFISVSQVDGGQGLRTMGRKDIHSLVGEVGGHEAGHALY